MKRITFLITAVLAMFLFVLGSPGQATAQDADDPALAEAGKIVFETNCAGCHGADGSGSGPGRNLAGVASENGRATHIASVTDGKGRMPEFGTKLSAEEIEQAVTYVRLTFLAAPAEAETTAETTAETDEAPAAETTAETELALTGVSSGELALLGATLLLGGAQLVIWSKRERS